MDIHKELKIFVAKNSDVNMTELVVIGVVKELQSRGHKFESIEIAKSLKKEK